MVKFLYYFALIGFVLLTLGCGDSEKHFKIDPLRGDQWYINGDVNNSEWIHINLHNDKYAGRGVLVSLVDNGVDTEHEDLRRNIGISNYSYLPKKYDFNYANHGTCVAGIIAASKDNGLGGRGIAPEATIVGYNVLKAPSISNFADALVRNKEKVWVSNNSWGDFNSWGEPFALRSLLELSLKEGVTNGRYGKGTIYIFSAGNGATEEDDLPTDNVNYSGLVNNRYTVPVCAVDQFGKRTNYSEIGATLVVCAPSKGKNTTGITTTDIMGEKGYNSELFKNDYKNQNYTNAFSGTSASAPMVSGVVALMLEANPNLGWRDVKSILAKSAKVVDRNHDDWLQNSAGLHINHHYGFGIVDADKAIEMAIKWTNYSDEKIVEKRSDVGISIPDGDIAGVVDEIYIDANFTVEFIDIFFDAPDHAKLGNLEVTLESPTHTESILAKQHQGVFEGAFRYKNWRFGSMRHLDEGSKGAWRLHVQDKEVGHVGTFNSWTIKIYGH